MKIYSSKNKISRFGKATLNLPKDKTLLIKAKKEKREEATFSGKRHLAKQSYEFRRMNTIESNMQTCVCQ